MAKTVVILGGSFAGLHIAHYLLKQRNPDIKVIIVSKNSHFYWNIASVRAIIPGVLKDEQLFEPLSSALSRYPSSSYELIIGAADTADFDARTVMVTPVDGGAARTLQYDQLVLATGTRANRTCDAQAPWKAAGTHEETLALLRDVGTRIAAAQHIVVAGAGATGVEVAGELGFEFGKSAPAASKKEIVLLASGDEILGGDPVAGNARAELTKLGVTIKTGSVAESATTTADGKTEVKLRDGSVIKADLFLPATGLVPNSEYVDKKYLNEKNLVEVDGYFRVPGVEGVWALGDIVSKPKAGFIITQKQAATVAKNIEAVLKGKEPAVVKGVPFDVVICAIGRSRGAGRIGSLKLLSFIVWMGKGRTLALPSLVSYVDGSVA